MGDDGVDKATSPAVDTPLVLLILFTMIFSEEIFMTSSVVNGLQLSLIIVACKTYR